MPQLELGRDLHSNTRAGVCATVFLILVGCGGGGGGGTDPGDSGGATDSAADTAAECMTDSQCDDGAFCNGPERCNGGTCEAGTAPCTADMCDEDGDMCANCPDADGDSHADQACGGDDCDDNDPMRFPGNAESCDDDGHDEDCNPSTFGMRDNDSDGFVSSACCNEGAGGVPICGNDCDDANPTAHPTQAEICDGIDNDCNGSIDEGSIVMLWPDGDGDMFGDGTAEPVMGCASDHPDRAPNDTDCDDTDASVNPGATEVCDLDDVDEDCDPSTLGDRDNDDDGFIAPVCCNTQAGGELLCGADCDDNDDLVHPGATELCDEVDNDCDPSTFGDQDSDADGFVSDTCCNAQDGAPDLCGDDCDDTDATVFPGAPELCDGQHNDCDNGEGVDVREDRDGDGHTREGYTGCNGGFPKDDCMDDPNRNGASIHPGQDLFFDTGYCPANTCACTDGTCGTPGMFGCISVCLTGSEPRSFDYNCDDSVTREPVGSSTCSSCSLGPPATACAGGGAIYAGTPACGSTITRVSCSGCPCNKTTNNSSQLGCR